MAVFALSHALSTWQWSSNRRQFVISLSALASSEGNSINSTTFSLKKEKKTNKEENRTHECPEWQKREKEEGKQPSPQKYLNVRFVSQVEESSNSLSCHSLHSECAADLKE